MVDDMNSIQKYLDEEIKKRVKEERRIQILRKLADDTSTLLLRNAERYMLSDL